MRKDPIKHDLIILTRALSGTELRPLTAVPSEDITAFDADVLYKDFNPEVAKATLPAMLRVVKEQVAFRAFARYLRTHR